MARPAPKPPWRLLSIVLLSVLALLTGSWLASRLAVEWQWFEQFGFQSVLLKRWWYQLLAFAGVLGIGLVLQLKQLQRCWRLRQSQDRKDLPPRPIVQLQNSPLILALVGLMVLLIGSLGYLLIQAKGLIAAPFSGEVMPGLPVLKNLLTSLT